MKVNRKIIEIDEELCNGCGQCTIDCAEGAIEIIDGKAKVISDNLCDGLGACIGNCPEDALKIIEREADEFDEEAVEEHLSERAKASPKEEKMACGCPSKHIQEFMPETPCQAANQPLSMEPAQSALRHWPVQIRLVPPTAPFLKNADLLVTADCVPVAFPNFHNDLLKGKAVMMGCPKFDETQAYIEKFTDVFNTAELKSITCVIMEVPCCSGLPVIIEKALKASGKIIPFEMIVVNARGQVIEQNRS